MPRALLFLLLFVFVSGIVVVALPDNNPRLFSLSTEHGPSPLDVLGLLLIFIPYALMIGQVIKNRRQWQFLQTTKLFQVGLFLAGLGLGLIIASVIGDHLYWWVYGAIFLIMVQLPVFYHGLK